MSFETIDVWRKVTPELQAELVDFWARHGAIADPARAQARALQAVVVARDADGALCGVATALLRTLPRLRQPTYYYRQFFAPEYRGNKQALPFFEAACRILEAGNKQEPESLGVLLELENSWLNGYFTEAVGERIAGVFIGYSPRGHQLRALYFEGAKLFPPAPVRAVRSAQGAQAGQGGPRQGGRPRKRAGIPRLT